MPVLFLEENDKPSLQDEENLLYLVSVGGVAFARLDKHDFVVGLAAGVTDEPMLRAGDETDLDRIDGRAEDDRNGRGRSLGRERPLRAAWCCDDRHPAPDQISRQFRQPIVLILRPAILDRSVN